MPESQCSKTLFGFITIAVAGLALLGCMDSAEKPPENEPPAAADMVLTGGRVYTVDPDQPWAEAIAVSGDRLVAVGTDQEIRTWVGDDTEVIDLQGRLVLPGLIDAHLHPVRGALKNLYECKFPFSASPETIATTVEACVAEQPDATWIRGGQWDSSFFEYHELASPRRFLDAVSGDKAVLLIDDSGHNAWANSRALEIAGITKDTPDPDGGSIGRDADGVPDGVLLETAPKLVYPHVPEYSEQQMQAAVREFSRIASAYGITGARAAATYEPEMAAFQVVDQAGELDLHVGISIRTQYGKRTEPLDYADLERIRDQYASTHVDLRYVKIFLDGVPTVARTAAMLDPYTPDDTHEPGWTGGLLHVENPLLSQDLVALDARGFTVKLHAAGDRSVREALNAIEAARSANGPSGLRHDIAHAGYVHPDDVGRFAQLNAYPDLSPVIWHPSPIIQSVLDAVGERGQRYWPVRDLIDAGARPVAGSDWPSAVPDANPWTGIEALVSRRHPRGETEGTLWPEQAVTLEEAIAIYTINGAHALRLEASAGSLQAGKSADLIVLDRNLFEIPIDEVSEVRPELTLFEGRVVYRAP